MDNHIKIFDTTLRDGEQSPGFSMNQDDKLRLALQLERLQVDVIEAGFPIASEGDYNTVRAISKNIQHSTVAALCRTKQKDIDQAAAAIELAAKPRIHTFIATSDIHMEHKLKKNRDEVLEDAVQAVEHATKFCKEVEFSAEDASRSDPQFLYQIFEAVINAGAQIINVPDTVGYAMPWEFGTLIRNIRKNVSNIEQATLSVHCHNDLGVGVANSLMAIRNGAEQVECTINGIGERAGNASLEEIVMSIATRDINRETNIQTEQLVPSSKLLTAVTGHNVQPNKAIVGDNAFAHEAGIHQHGVLNNPMTYEIMTPKSVGLESNKIVLGKHSGRFALNRKLQKMGYNLGKEELNQVYIEFTRVADEQKRVKENDLLNLISQTLPQKNISVDSAMTG